MQALLGAYERHEAHVAPARALAARSARGALRRRRPGGARGRHGPIESLGKWTRATSSRRRPFARCARSSSSSAEAQRRHINSSSPAPSQRRRARHLPRLVGDAAAGHHEEATEEDDAGRGAHLDAAALWQDVQSPSSSPKFALTMGCERAPRSRVAPAVAAIAQLPRSRRRRGLRSPARRASRKLLERMVCSVSASPFSLARAAAFPFRSFSRLPYPYCVPSVVCVRRSSWK